MRRLGDGYRGESVRLLDTIALYIFTRTCYWAMKRLSSFIRIFIYIFAFVVLVLHR